MSAAPATVSAKVSLDDKYTSADGRVLISGLQALVRLTLEQRRLDDRRGLNTRVFVSGYQGSPLAGLDLEMGRAARLLDAAGVVFTPGLNEELAATAVAGTQLLDPYGPLGCIELCLAHRQPRVMWNGVHNTRGFAPRSVEV